MTGKALGAAVMKWGWKSLRPGLGADWGWEDVHAEQHSAAERGGHAPRLHPHLPDHSRRPRALLQRVHVCSTAVHREAPGAQHSTMPHSLPMSCSTGPFMACQSLQQAVNKQVTAGSQATCGGRLTSAGQLLKAAGSPAQLDLQVAACQLASRPFNTGARPAEACLHPAEPRAAGRIS